jgi:glycosidase
MRQLPVITILLFRVLFSFGQNATPLGDWMPVTLEKDTTLLFLEDFYLHPEEIDSVSGPDWLTCTLLKETHQLRVVVQEASPPPMGMLRMYQRKYPQAPDYLVVNSSQKKTVEWQFNPKGKTYTSVGIMGDINGWDASKTPLSFQDGIWTTEVVLNPGRYQYLVVADGQPMMDPNNPIQVANGIGGINSLMIVGEKDRTQLPYFYLQSTEGLWVHIGRQQHSDDRVFAIWNNRLLPIVMEGDGFKVKIPDIAESIPTGTIRIFGYNNAGPGNDMLIPLQYNAVVQNPQAISRKDFHTSVMYFILVDRFVNGDTTNDQPIQDERLDFKTNYQGGDLAGILKKVEDGYFTEMGFNTLWLSPVFQNPREAYMEYPAPHRWFAGYHGYWPISLSQVDDRFGTNALYKALVDTLHNRNMNIVLDYIANHVHSEHPLWSEHPEWFSSLDLPDGRKNLRLWDEQRLTTWFEPYMPSLDHAQPVVAEAFADSALWWLNTYGVDGFRHDATKHIEIEFWRLLTRKIKTEYGMPVYQIGETFGNRELIGSYVGSGLLDAQFDFNTYFDARNILAMDESSFIDLSSSLHNTFDYYGYHHLMGNITGNHDLARFISFAGKGLKWNEDDKEAGWERDIKVEDPTGYKKLSMLHAFIMTIPGIPIVYYGDEIGMPGAGDPDNRRMMDFDHMGPNEITVRNTLKKLAHVRRENMALLYGDFQELSVTEDTWVYSRHYLNNHVVVVMNKGNAQANMAIPLTDIPFEGTPEAVFGTPYTLTNGTLQLRLPAHSFDVFVVQ